METRETFVVGTLEQESRLRPGEEEKQRKGEEAELSSAASG